MTVFNDFTLVLNVEGPGNLGEGNKSEKLEEELLLCIKSWRTHFEDMPILLVCSNGNGITDKTLDALSDDIEYILYDMPITQTFECGYLNIPLGLSIATDHVRTPNIIHIDLDMTIINVKPLHRYLEQFLATKIPIIGRLNDNETKELQLPGLTPSFNFESNFIIAPLEFYRAWWEYTEFLHLNLSPELTPEELPEIEEWAIDSISYKYTIEGVIDYQIGERYPTINVSNFNNVIFHHGHIDEGVTELRKWLLKQY